MAQKQLSVWDKKYLWHPFTQQYLWEKSSPLIITSGRGATLKDQHGRSYLDGVSSLWVNLHGHNHPVLNKAFKKQLSKIAHSTFLGLSHEPAILLGKALADIAPRGLKRTFYSDNGATAVEVALKMAFQYWVERGQKRTYFLALKGSYHGDTLGAVSVGGIGAFHSKFKPLLFKSKFAMQPSCVTCPFNRTGVRHRTRLGEPVEFVPKPGQFRAETGCRWECLNDVEKNLKKQAAKISAAILEPVVQAASGMHVMPSGYVAGFRRLCTRYNILMIADEVATGFCRTGALFAVDQERVSPDILCLAKAITGGYSPLAVTMTTEKIYKAFWGPPGANRTFFHGHSYTAHPLGAAVAHANLKLIRSGKLLEKSIKKAHLLRGELLSLEGLPIVGSIRQAGLMAGVELQGFDPQRHTGARICRKLLSSGIWLRPLGDVIVLMPPPVISDGDIKRMVRALKAALHYEGRNLGRTHGVFRHRPHAALAFQKPSSSPHSAEPSGR